MDTVLSAYERFGARLPWPAVIVYGPFLPTTSRAAFERRAARLKRVTTLTFHEHLESLMEKAAAVVCLGGYNTFCEVLSLQKRSLIVPRVTPRAEQLLRAEAAEKLGLVRMLHPTDLNPVTLADALAQLPAQPPPMRDRIPGLLDGLSYISATVARWRLARDETSARPAGRPRCSDATGSDRWGPVAGFRRKRGPGAARGPSRHQGRDAS